MKPLSNQILVTSALPYANGQIHIGHLVEYIQTDIWVRFLRMQHKEIYYIGADDTHGTPIMLRAQAENITPKELIDRVWLEHKRDFNAFHCCFGAWFDDLHYLQKMDSGGRNFSRFTGFSGWSRNCCCACAS